MNKKRKWRMSLILITVFLMSLLGGAAMAYETDVIPLDFFDLDENHWASQSMTQLIEMGIVKGYAKEVTEDGERYTEYYIKPDQLITRAEFATILAQALNLKESAIGSAFSDVSGHWAEGYIYDLYNGGIINGYPDGTVRPEEKVRRGEIVTMLTKALNNRDPVTDAVSFTDVRSKDDHWSYDSMQKAVSMGIIKGYADGSFKPDGKATRAEVMTMLALFLNNDLTTGAADEELVSVVTDYQKKSDEILKSAPDLKNEESPYNWSPVYQYVTGAEKLSMEAGAELFNQLALFGVNFTYELLEQGKAEVVSKSDRTAVVKQYSKIRMKAGAQEDTIEGNYIFKLMKEDGKWLIYSSFNADEPQLGDEPDPALGLSGTGLLKF